MKTFISLFISCIILLFTISTAAQSSSFDYETLRDAHKYSKDASNSVMVALETNQHCRANGYSEAECSKAAVLCAIYDYTANNPPPGISSSMFEKLGLFELFKLACGGECFQCCFDGNNCHTSFVGFPKVNCNDVFYPSVTRPAGMALLIDAAPGSSCLGARQICNHLAKCLSGLSDASITSVNNDPNHVMKSDAAYNQRANSYTINMINHLNDFLNNFSSGKPAYPLGTSVPPILDEVNILDLYDLFSARGTIEWQSFLDSLQYISLSHPAFAIYDGTTNELLEGPSRWNMAKQFYAARLLSSLPYLEERFEFVEGYIWKGAELDNYLNLVGNPDSLLQTRMTQLAYYFYKKNTMVQDYRLLAVPVGPVPKDMYAGGTLGKAAVIELEKSTVDNKATFNISMLYPGTHNSNYPFSGLVYWGDGTATQIEIADLMTVKTIEHTYPESGKYQAFTIIQNSTGLRTFKFDEVNIQSNVVLDIEETPVMNNIRLANFKISRSNGTFTDYLGLDIYGGLKSEELLLNRLAISDFLQNTEIHSYDTLNINNANFFDLDSLIIKPRYIADDDWNAKTYLHFTGIDGLIYNSALKKNTVVSLPINKDSIRIYDTNGNKLNNSELIIGSYRIQIEVHTTNIGKIVIPIDKQHLKNYYVSPNNINSQITHNNLYLENNLDEMSIHTMPSCGYELMNISNKPIPTNTYRAAGKIISEGIVKQNSTVSFEAKNTIELLPGFIAEKGAVFEAKIVDCTDGIDNLSQKNSKTENTQLLEKNENEHFTKTSLKQQVSLTKNSKVYPNPTTDLLHFLYASERKEKLNIQVFDVLGHLVYNDLTWTHPKNYKYTIPMKEYPSGIYLLKVTNANGQTSFKQKILKVSNL